MINYFYGLLYINLNIIINFFNKIFMIKNIISNNFKSQKKDIKLKDKFNNRFVRCSCYIKF